MGGRAKRSSKATEPEWSVYLLRKRAQRIGHVRAKDQEEALRRTYEMLEVTEAERFRVSAQRPG